MRGSARQRVFRGDGLLTRGSCGSGRDRTALRLDAAERHARGADAVPFQPGRSASFAGEAPAPHAFYRAAAHAASFLIRFLYSSSTDGPKESSMMERPVAMP